MTAAWPPLPLAGWRDTCETLHRYAQIVGKIQLAATPRICHWWNVALDVTPRGLGTAALRHQGRSFEMEFDLVEHALVVRTSDGQHRRLPLRPLAVADFYAEVMATLDSLGLHVEIWEQPVELANDSIPFPQDRMHAAYDPEWANRFWQVLVHAADALGEFRSRFIGKASPVGFYWGTFDLAAARYSGRRAPQPPAGVIEGEAFSHEVSEVGFWPGDVRYEEPAFYGMHAPAPDGYARAKLKPREATWHDKMGCFLLPYEAVRTAASPRETLLEFFQSTYEAGANLAHWDRADLERAA
jgi:hypothetical protein